MRLRELREEKGLYQKDIGKLLGKVSNCISNWETGTTEPSIKDIIKLADYFQVSTDYLLGRENDYGFVEVKGIELSKIQKVMINIFDKLNASGQLKAVSYAEGLAESPEFKK